EFKYKISQLSGIPVEEQSLSFGAKPLSDLKELKDYEIPNLATIYLGIKLRGGMQTYAKYETIHTSPDKPLLSPIRRRKYRSKFSAALQDVMHQDNILPPSF